MKAQAKWMIVISALVGATALAAPIRGTVRLPEGTTPEPEGGLETYYWKVWNGFLDPRTPRRDPGRELAVVLTGSGVEAPIGCTYRIQGGDLYPRTLVAKGGAALSIENRDGCAHELQSEDIPDFAPLATSPGNARAINVPAGGPYAISDRLYPHVQGTVHALSDLVACARVDSQGRFLFEGIPNGSYTLKIFDGADEVHTAPVEVADNEPLTVDPIALGGN
ncbi:MAG: carboxypeptidase-like regulatory domain-containing protein [Myxococcota bacterium]